MYPKKSAQPTPSSLGKPRSTRHGDEGMDAKFQAITLVMLSEIDDIPMEKEQLVQVIEQNPLDMFEIVERLERAADMLRAAATLANLQHYPTHCPRCGENLIEHVRHEAKVSKLDETTDY